MFIRRSFHFIIVAAKLIKGFSSIFHQPQLFGRYGHVWHLVDQGKILHIQECATRVEQTVWPQNHTLNEMG